MALAYRGLNARKCRRCGNAKSHVFGVRITKNDLLERKRECLNCGFRWSTIEVEQMTFEQMVHEDEKWAFEECQRRYEAAQEEGNP